MAIQSPHRVKWWVMFQGWMVYAFRAFPKQTVENPGIALWTHGWNSYLLHKIHHPTCYKYFHISRIIQTATARKRCFERACLVGKLGTFVIYSSKHKFFPYHETAQRRGRKYKTVYQDVLGELFSKLCITGLILKKWGFFFLKYTWAQVRIDNDYIKSEELPQKPTD